MSTQGTTSIKIDSETRERIQRLAAAKQRSAHWLMREAIEQYVDREEQRQGMWADAMSAYERYQADGLHVSGEEADEWLAKLEAGGDEEPPECHE